MGLVIDTSVLIAIERRRQNLDIVLSAIENEQLALSAITASELLTRIHLADSVDRKLRRETSVEATLHRIAVLPFDLRVARTHAELWAQLTGAGQIIGAHDLIIAATAVTYGYSLLTHNIRDFRRVPGLQLQQPGW